MLENLILVGQMVQRGKSIEEVIYTWMIRFIPGKDLVLGYFSYAFRGIFEMDLSILKEFSQHQELPKYPGVREKFFTRRISL